MIDGRWKLIARQKTETSWRQVNADSRQFKLWGNRVYQEIIRLRDKDPTAFRILAEMDPQQLGGTVPELELYDLQSDPDEMNDLSDSPEHRPVRQRLLDRLKRWVVETEDPAIDVEAWQ